MSQREEKSSGWIEIDGIRTNNLRDIQLRIPRNRMTVITGVSGSGKSSLAFDTLYGIGLRMYLETLSEESRSWLDHLPRLRFDRIQGIQPMLCLDQRLRPSTPQQTVGTLSNTYDCVRLLLAKSGTPICPRCQRIMSTHSQTEILKHLVELPLESRVILLAPIARRERIDARSIMERVRALGLLRGRLDRHLFEVDDSLDCDRTIEHDLEVVVDRWIVREPTDTRPAEALALALEISGGEVVVLCEDRDHLNQGVTIEKFYSIRGRCASCNYQPLESEPRLFNFNSPHGACPRCRGLGLVPSEPSPSELDDHRPSGNARGNQAQQPRANRRAQKSRAVQKIICPDCQGRRLRQEAGWVQIDGIAVDDLVSQPIEKLLEQCRSWSEQLTHPAARPILDELIPRLQFLVASGVGYLTLGRSAQSLSGGEMQRVRLSASLGSGMINVCYVLDEPSMGLHAADHENLLAILRKLRDAGNTLVVVEHDRRTMEAADWLIDLGPGAGPRGGTIVAQGHPKDVMSNANSLTARYLRNELHVSDHSELRLPSRNDWLTLSGASGNNLQQVVVPIPLRLLVGIAGVSGSGKSTLVLDTLVPALQHKLGLAMESGLPYSGLVGWETIQRLVVVDAAPIGRTPKSVPATYCDLMNEIQLVFAETRAAKQRGFRQNHFSFNAGPGRCSECDGQGFVKHRNRYLENPFAPCGVCSGRRFNAATLKVQYKNRNIAEVLEMTVSEAKVFFENFDRIHRKLAVLEEVGLGYLVLGQSATTLSGGECQRLKLANELGTNSSTHTLYILDEPTSGLHFDDIRRVIGILLRLVSAQNSVIIIEHNLDVLRSCDWLIELGPGGGVHGGKIIGSGAPDQLATLDTPTGKSLRPLLADSLPR